MPSARGCKMPVGVVWREGGMDEVEGMSPQDQQPLRQCLGGVDNGIESAFPCLCAKMHRTSVSPSRCNQPSIKGVSRKVV